jgi:hypothetical protein
VAIILLVMGDDFDLTKLPPPDTKRWVVRRKAVVVQAVRNGSISLQEACQRYSLSSEEFLAWERAIDRYGVPGLRATRVQIYRDADEALAAKPTRAASPGIFAAASGNRRRRIKGRTKNPASARAGALHARFPGSTHSFG